MLLVQWEESKQDFLPPPRMHPPGKLIFLQRGSGEPRFAINLFVKEGAKQSRETHLLLQH